MIIAVLAGVLPLCFALNLHDTFDLPKLGLVYVVTSLLLGIWLWRERAAVWRKTPLDAPFALFIVILALSSVFSIDRYISWAGSYRIYVFGFWPLAAMAVLFWVTAQNRDPKLAARVELAIICGGALAGLYGVLQVMGIEFFAAMPKVRDGRPWSSLGNPLYLGAVCMMALLLTLGAWIERKRDKFFLFFAGAMQVAGLALSLSRSAWLGTLAGVLFISLARVKAVPSSRPSPHPCLPAGRFGGRRGLLAAVGITVVLFSIPASRHRLSNMFSLSESSNAARIEGWKGAAAVWRQYPLLGSGPDTFFQAFRPHRSLAYIRATGTSVTQAHAHNDPLQIAATMGTLGLLAYLWILWVAARRLESGPAAAALIALWVQNLFNFSSITTSVWAALLLGLALPKQDLALPAFKKAGVFWKGVALAIPLLAIAAVARAWSVDAQFKQGLALAQGGQPVQALTYFRIVGRLRPAIETYTTEWGNAARALAVMAGEGSLKPEMLKEAWQAASLAPRYHPANPDAWNNLGVAAMWRTQVGGENALPEARAAFEKAVSLDPLFVDAWANLAKWRHIAGDLDGEKNLWQKVLTIDPLHPMAKQVLGR